MDYSSLMQRALAPPKRACDQCRKCRVKCEISHGKCLRCIQEGLACTYLDPARKRGPKPRLNLNRSLSPTSPTFFNNGLSVPGTLNKDLLILFLTKINSSDKLLNPSELVALLEVSHSPSRVFLLNCIYASTVICLTNAPLSDDAINSYNEALESMPLDISCQDLEFQAAIRILNYIQAFCCEITKQFNPTSLL